jgi:hypothetical protein
MATPELNDTRSNENETDGTLPSNGRGELASVATDAITDRTELENDAGTDAITEMTDLEKEQARQIAQLKLQLATQRETVATAVEQAAAERATAAAAVEQAAAERARATAAERDLERAQAQITQLHAVAAPAAREEAIRRCVGRVLAAERSRFSSFRTCAQQHRAASRMQPS